MNTAKFSTINIKTPEGIVFSLQTAGPATRFTAWLIDFFVIIAIISGIKSVVLKLVGLFSWDMAIAVVTFMNFAIGVAYGIVLEWHWRGQTIGKRLLRLRVMDAQGLKLQFSQVVIRNLLRPVDQLPGLYLVGGVVSLINAKQQRLGDIAANTIVVWQPVSPAPELSRILPDKYNSFRSYPHLAARLRQRTSPYKAGIALDALIRRNQLDAQARIDLFSAVSAHFKALVEFPPEAIDGISDEQYVRNVVDVLYR